MQLERIDVQNRKYANALIEKHFFSLEVVCRDEVIDMTLQDGFLCTQDGAYIGVITWQDRGDMLDVTALCTDVAGQGVGTRLLTKAKEAAVLQNKKGVTLITTNDNIRALYFYQTRGFWIKGIDIGAVGRARKIKPVIPLFGEHDIPLRDEIELVWRT